MLKKTEKISCLDCSSRKSSLFSELGLEHLEQLSDVKSCVKYKKGQLIFHEGSRPQGLFCVNAGKIKVFKEGSQGKEQIIHFCKPGDFLGYRALLSEENYNASAEVLEEATVCFVPKSEFLRVFQEDSVFVKKIMKSVCHEVGVMEDKIINLAQKSVRERLALTLLMLKETYGIEGEGKSLLIDIALSREDLANIVGTATETVIRLLSDFKESGLISTDGKKIKILNIRALVKEADFYA
jgi:CRP-like cAMP-binding protein